MLLATDLNLELSDWKEYGQLSTNTLAFEQELARLACSGTPGPTVLFLIEETVTKEHSHQYFIELNGIEKVFALDPNDPKKQQRTHIQRLNMSSQRVWPQVKAAPAAS
jgi:hypothetical protein